MAPTPHSTPHHLRRSAEVTDPDPHEPGTGNARRIPIRLLRLPTTPITPAVQDALAHHSRWSRQSRDHACPGNPREPAGTGCLARRAAGADPDRYHQLMADVLVRAGGVLLAGYSS